MLQSISESRDRSSDGLDGNGAQTAYDQQRQLGQDLRDNGRRHGIGQHHDDHVPRGRLQKPPDGHNDVILRRVTRKKKKNYPDS